MLIQPGPLAVEYLANRVAFCEGMREIRRSS